jgi:uncharacterized protein YbjT (DUF2867 family)
MRILLLGASGFIGRELFAVLSRRGHRVVPAVRDPALAPPFAGEAPLLVDLNRDTTVDTWQARLQGFDAVVNCAGVLQGTRTQSIDAIHSDAPIALFRACEKRGIGRVVQISAISAEREAGTSYARTKLAADDALRASSLEWVVLRPSLVHARGAYGGTALFRGLAALPFAIPLPGRGEQEFQPIHVEDLASVVVKAVESDALVRRTLDPVGPDVVTLRAILEDYRRWLGFGAARVVPVPDAIVRLATRIGDWLGGPMNSTALSQLEYGNTGDYARFARDSGIQALGWRQALAAHPAQQQDRWHARLYFVRPLLRIALATLWVASGIIGFFALGEWSMALAQRLHAAPKAMAMILGAACTLDLVFAGLVMSRWRPRAMTLVQVFVIAAYTLGGTIFWPDLWADPVGPLLKNLPILAAVLALGAIEEDR